MLSADDSELEELAVKATRRLKEAVVKKKRLDQINAVGSSGGEDRFEIDAVSSGKAKAGIICSNHPRFPGNCFRCLEPERCLLKDAIIPRPAGSSSSSSSKKRSGNSRAGRQ